MNITTFDPIIITSKFDDAVKTFEDLGFEKTHAPVTETSKGDVLSYRMKNEDGFHVDVAGVDSLAKDKEYIRMNVDNFEEAYNILKEHGFTNARGGDDVMDTNHAKEATMISPTGFTIALVRHMQ
jgi:hypothetical protein